MLSRLVFLGVFVPVSGSRVLTGCSPSPQLAELKQECLARGLEAKGNKQDLINRLQAYLEEHGGYPECWDFQSPLPPAVGSFCAESHQASAFVWECWLECFAAAWLLSSPLYQQGFV